MGEQEVSVNEDGFLSEEKISELEMNITGKQLRIDKETSEELESSVVRIHLLRRSLVGTAMFVLLSVFSLGLFYVFSKWFDTIWRRLCFRRATLGRSNFIELKSDGSSRKLPLFDWAH